MQIIAHIRCAFADKFGVPRQSGLAPLSTARIVFEPKYREIEALRGLEGFDYIWLIWVFSENLVRRGSSLSSGADGAGLFSSNGAGAGLFSSNGAEAGLFSSNGAGAGWQPTVRPPRLGGNRRMGVFATRSTFRPNPIGLSSVRLLRVFVDPVDGPVLEVSGADLVDGTPILDIKPYLRYCDSHPDAACGWVDTIPEKRLRVAWACDLPSSVPPATPGSSPATPGSLPARPAIPSPTDLRAELEQILSLDPRPSYIDDPDRSFGLTYHGLDIRFTVTGDTLTVHSATPGREKTANRPWRETAD